MARRVEAGFRVCVGRPGLTMQFSLTYSKHMAKNAANRFPSDMQAHMVASHEATPLSPLPGFKIGTMQCTRSGGFKHECVRFELVLIEAALGEGVPVSAEPSLHPARCTAVTVC